MSETCTCVSTSEVTISSISRASIRSAAWAAPSRGRRRHSSGWRRPLDLHFRQVHKESPLLADKVPDLRCLCVGGYGRDSHLACCTTAAAAKAESPPPAGRGSNGSTAIARQAQELRGGSDGSAGAPIPGTSWRRARRLRRRETGTLGAGRAKTPVEGVASGRRRNSRRLLDQPRPDAYGGRRWRRAREMSAGTNRNPSTVLAPASRVAVRRGKVAGHAFLDAYGEASPGLPAHSSSSARPADRIVASHRGEDGESRVTRSTFAPPRSTRVRLRSPAQDPRRGIRESLPARPIVTALRSDQCLST